MWGPSLALIPPIFVSISCLPRSPSLQWGASPGGGWSCTQFWKPAAAPWCSLPGRLRPHGVGQPPALCLGDPVPEEWVGPPALCLAPMEQVSQMVWLCVLHGNSHHTAL